MKLKQLFKLIKTTLAEWNEDRAPQLAAALSYYTIFSLAPLLVVVISVAGLIAGQQQVQTQVVTQIGTLVGEDGAQLVETMIEGASNRGAGVIATIVGLVSLGLGASGVFGQLKTALNTIWDVESVPGPGGIKGILFNLKNQFVSFTMVLGTGFLLLVSLVISAALSAFDSAVGANLPIAPEIWQLINTVISFAAITVLFAMIYRVLPDLHIAWNDVWLGAVITALLFTIGKTLIGLYLGHSSVSSTYGAAGSLIVILLWVNYSAQILLLGAEFTQVYASQYGSLAKQRAAMTARASAYPQRTAEEVARRFRPEPTVKPLPSQPSAAVLRVVGIVSTLAPFLVIGMRAWIQWTEIRDRLRGR